MYRAAASRCSRWAVAMTLLGYERGESAATIPIRFKAELDRVKAAAPGAKVVYVDRLVTGTVVAGGAPRPSAMSA